MTITTYRLEVLTPCFCAGADQARAEIRAPSIRGQLRWWFRVLGGTPEQEKNAFGGVHGEVVASSTAVRVTGQNARPMDARVLPRPNQNLHYLFHFAKASGNGIRYTAEGCLAPGSAFDLQLVARRALGAPDSELLEGAVTAFRRLGSLGLRQTRGLGALADTGEALSLADFATWSASLASRAEVCWALGPDAHPVFCADWGEALRVLEGCLRSLRKRFPEKQGPSPLGHSKPRERQASGVHLRPVRLKEGLLPVVFYAAATLDAPSCAAGFRLAGFRFAHPWARDAVADHQLGRADSKV